MSTTSFPFTASNLKRYKDIALLFWSCGHDDLLNAPGAANQFGDDELDEQNRNAEELTDRLEAMGPTFVKIGQLLSTRSDLLQQSYLDALSRLQEDVEPVPFADIESTISDGLGVRISKAFTSFDETPLASASLGQVHRATLRSGRKVVVKVQRPGIRKQVGEDLDSLASIAEFADKHSDAGRTFGFARIVEQFRQSILRELDYNREAHHLERFRTELGNYPDIVIPATVPDLCSDKVLTMDYLEGTSITKLSGVALNEIDGARLADQLFDAYLYQVLVLGSFHADPHPGNLLITPDHKLALIDLGMVGHVDEPLRETLTHFLIAVSEFRGTTAAQCAIRMGTPSDRFQKDDFIAAASQLVAENATANVGEMKIGTLVLAVTKLCGEHGLIIPDSVVLLGKALLNLDIIADTLAPDFNPASAIREKCPKLLNRQIKEQFSLGEALATARDLRDLVADLPGKANKLLDLAADNKLSINVEAVDEELLIRSFQKIANRITAGLVIAALIIGAAMLMDIESSWTLMGYPGLAIILFLFASAGAVALAWNVLFKDR